MSSPVVGVLTRNLIPTPVVKLIIPARIRHKDKNDVLFISECAVEIKEVEIKEYVYDVHLRDVALKMDFGSRIRSARVFGDPIKPILLPEEGLDAIIKIEEQNLMQLDGNGLQYVPPQILVLALESDSLVFLFAHPDPSYNSGFVSFWWPLLRDREGRLTRKLGKHIAIDPRSRALAVAAQEGVFTIYALKSMTKLRDDMECEGSLLSDKFKPLAQEKHMSVNGIILKMEFLYPPKGDENHVILLLVINIRGQTRLIHYEWDCTSNLQSIEPLKSAHSVGRDEQLPLLLIPFTTSTSFMLVCETMIAQYNNILTGWSPPQCTKLDDEELPEEDGSSRRRPLWTQWARPIRHEVFETENEVIYLCREDGVVRFYEFSDSRYLYPGRQTVGKLDVNVDTAFASISFYYETHDILIVGGNLSDGGVYTLVPRLDAQKQQSIACWAPVVDLITATVTDSARGIDLEPTSNNSRPRNRERVFACVGKGSRYGGICEMRYGIQALSSVRINIEPLGIAGVVGMWILPGISGTLILLTDPARTYLLLLEASGGEVRDVSEELCEDGIGLNILARTIIAGSTADEIIIQITEQSIHAISPQCRQPFVKNLGKDEKIIAGYIQGSVSAVIVAVVENDKVLLSLLLFSHEEMEIILKHVGQPIQLSSAPSCISLQVIESQMYALVGTITGSIQIFRGSSDGQLSPLIEHRFEGDFAICESVAILQKTVEGTDQSHFLILCGLRNGSLQIFHLKPLENAATYALVHCETIILGSTSVLIRPDLTSSADKDELCSRAFLVCGDDFCRVEYAPNQSRAKTATVNSIWITDQEEPNFQQGTIIALAQPSRWSSSQSNTGSLYCIERSNLHIAEIDLFSKPRALPRRFPVGGTPSRLIYSNRFSRLIVGFTKIVVRSDRQTGGHHGRTKSKRLLFPMLTFIDPCEDSIVKLEPEDESVTRSTTQDPVNSNNPSEPVAHCIGESGERILGILEWFPSDNGTTYHLIVINTSRARTAPKDPTGRILFYALTWGLGGRVIPTLKYSFPREDPVYCLASYGLASLVFCSGSELVLQRYSIPNGKVVDRATFTLRSKGRAISTQAPFIYVTTFRDSLMIFELDGNTLVPRFSDAVARDGLHHLLLLEQSIVMISDEADIITGLWQQPTLPGDDSTITLFEAKLPTSITRFHRPWIRPSWRSGSSGNAKTIIGSGTDGSFYQFEIIGEAIWRLLRFIQNMAERNPTICPTTHLEKKRRHLEPSTAHKHYMHVDGDILIRLLECGRPDSDTLLREMLHQEPQSAYRHYDFESAAARLQRFEELIDAIREEGNGDEDPIEFAVDYLRRNLQPAL